ncbi:MAG: hypothetical protein HOV94_24695 [Saccharothrix sp.]|nr:hypothetical protein [Saccharothrix sp.]
MRTPGGLGSALAVAVTFLVVAAGATRQPVLSVVALVAVVDLIALISTPVATVATAAVCWCLHSGFVLGRLGELAFTGQSRHDALVLAGCALGGILLASTLRAPAEPHRAKRVSPAAV